MKAGAQFQIVFSAATSAFVVVFQYHKLYMPHMNKTKNVRYMACSGSVHSFGNTTTQVYVYTTSVTLIYNSLWSVVAT